MAVTDAAITLAYFLKMQAPDGDVRLSEGGFLDYNGERYEGEHPVYGSILNPGEFESGFGDLTEGGTLQLAPNPDAAFADWYRSDLGDSRVQIWLGEVSGKDVASAEQVGDLLVDTVAMELAQGVQILRLELIARADKLFLTNEGNVCSTRFHEEQFPGELGFDNCTGIPGTRAWGVAAAPASSSGGGGGGGGGAPNNNVRLF